ncbi:MAG TPA: hypothetical protein ENN57_00935 [Chloroflexi bacterium]|nr:hypothetical protein [Chloroflexota bacterium]
MDHIDYNFLFKVFAFLFRYRKAFKLSNAGKALVWLFTRPAVARAMPYLIAFQRYVSIPAYFLVIFAAGCCTSAQHLIRTQSVLGFIGLMLLFNLLALIGARCLYRATPKVRVRLSITEA